MKTVTLILLLFALPVSAQTKKLPITARWGGPTVKLTDARSGKTWEESYERFFANCGGKHPSSLGVKVIGKLPDWWVEQERLGRTRDVQSVRREIAQPQAAPKYFDFDGKGATASKADAFAQMMVSKWQKFDFEGEDPPPSREVVRLPDEAIPGHNEPAEDPEPNLLLPHLESDRLTAVEASQHMARGTVPMTYDAQVDLAEPRGSGYLGQPVSILEVEESYERGIGPRPEWLGPEPDPVEPVESAPDPNLSGFTWDALVSFVKKKEGYSSKAYWDHSQYSIGYGTRSHKGEEITRAEADRRLQEELRKAKNEAIAVARAHGHSLSDGRANALASFNYNTGAIKRVFEKATDEGRTIHQTMNLWVYAGGKKNGGLVDRRRDEVKLFVSN